MDGSPESPVVGLSNDQQSMNPSEIYISFLRNAIADFEEKAQVRSAQEYKLQLANELIHQEQWDEAFRVLRPLWQGMTFRKEGWWDITEEICWALRAAAAKTGDCGTVIAVDWELMNNTFASKPDWRYDISRALEGISNVTSRPSVVIHEQDVHSFLSGTFTFDQAEGKVGEPCTSQLTVTSHASPLSSPVVMTEIKIFFEGNLRPVTIHHKSDEITSEGYDGAVFSKIILKENIASLNQISQGHARGTRSIALSGEGDLTFLPGKSRVFEFSCPLREAGEGRATSATFTMTTELFDLDYTVNFENSISGDVWWFHELGRKRIIRVDPHGLIILPKPPKMDLRFIEVKEQYYTNEPIVLQLEILNGEEEDSVANLAVQVDGEHPAQFSLSLSDTTRDVMSQSIAASLDLELGRISVGDASTATISISPLSISAIYDVIVELSYNLASDLATPISRKTSFRLLVASPFEANYDFSPRLDERPWPSFFDHAEISEADPSTSGAETEAIAHGLSQRWCLTTRYASFATETLVVEDIDLEIIMLNGGISCSTVNDDKDSGFPTSILPKNIEECRFSVLTQKLSLDDRRSGSLDLSFVIKWRRAGSNGSINTTKLAVPRLLVASTEPRVIATASYSTTIPPFIHLQYTIENPSVHFLTFGVTMNTSDKFAFSGVKQSTIQLLPLSRQTIRLQILPLVRGEWIRPVLVVKDRYFQKVLRVTPTDGMKMDKDGILVWVPPDED